MWMDVPTAKENSHDKRKERNLKMHKKWKEMHLKNNLKVIRCISICETVYDNWRKTPCFSF